jgi:hypothetical protein
VKRNYITGISVFIPMHVTALCTNPVSMHDSSSGASLTTSNKKKKDFSDTAIISRAIPEDVETEAKWYMHFMFLLKLQTN